MNYLTPNRLVFNAPNEQPKVLIAGEVADKVVDRIGTTKKPLSETERQIVEQIKKFEDYLNSEKTAGLSPEEKQQFANKAKELAIKADKIIDGSWFGLGESQELTKLSEGLNGIRAEIFGSTKRKESGEPISTEKKQTAENPEESQQLELGSLRAELQAAATVDNRTPIERYKAVITKYGELKEKAKAYAAIGGEEALKSDFQELEGKLATAASIKTNQPEIATVQTAPGEATVKEKTAVGEINKEIEGQVLAASTNVNLRLQPDISSEKTLQVAGTRFTATGMETKDDSHTWLEVKTADGKSGWIASEYLTSDANYQIAEQRRDATEKQRFAENTAQQAKVATAPSPKQADPSAAMEKQAASEAQTPVPAETATVAQSIPQTGETQTASPESQLNDRLATLRVKFGLPLRLDGPVNPEQLLPAIDRVENVINQLKTRPGASAGILGRIFLGAENKVSEGMRLVTFNPAKFSSNEEAVNFIVDGLKKAGQADLRTAEEKAATTTAS